MFPERSADMSSSLNQKCIDGHPQLQGKLEKREYLAFSFSKCQEKVQTKRRDCEWLWVSSQ